MIRNGFVEVGATADMVYMALDKPATVKPDFKPGDETWIYHNFYSTDGRSIAMSATVEKVSFGGGKSSGGGGGRGGGSGAAFQLVYDNSHTDTRSETPINILVIFHEGKVTDFQIVSNGRAKT